MDLAQAVDRQGDVAGRAVTELLRPRLIDVPGEKPDNFTGEPVGYPAG